MSQRKRHKKDSCRGKIRYAQHFVELEIQRQREFMGQEMRAYVCAKCGQWHLTRMSEEVRQRFVAQSF